MTNYPVVGITVDGCHVVGIPVAGFPASGCLVAGFCMASFPVAGISVAGILNVWTGGILKVFIVCVFLFL